MLRAASRTIPWRLYRSRKRDRPKSLSGQHSDEYWHACERTSPNYSGQADPCAMSDLTETEDLYRELLIDNLRLWECVNLIRCHPRTQASHVMQHIFSLTDQDFFQSYPTYSGFQQSGHGSLLSRYEGGGLHDPNKYRQHLEVHNDGLLRENSRLMLALDLLSRQPTRTADDVICHSFGLSDENFVKLYPTAARGTRLRAQLRRMKDDEQRRRTHRLSLPGFLQTLSGRSSEFSLPSCSNNNDVFNRDHRLGYMGDSKLVKSHISENHGQQEDTRSRRYKATRDELGGGSTADIYGSLGSLRRRRSTGSSPYPLDSRSTSPSKSVRSKVASRSANHLTRISPLPYMVAQYPYNWATANNSSIHLNDFVGRQGEGKEQNGLTYWRNGALNRHYNQELPFLKGRHEQRSLRQDSRISYSKIPASFTKQLENDSDRICHSRAGRLPFQFDNSFETKLKKSSKLPVPKHRRISRNQSLEEPKVTRGRKNFSPRMSDSDLHRQTLIPSPINSASRSPAMKRPEKNVKFDRKEGYTSSSTYSGSRSPSASPRGRRPRADNSELKPRPVYYKSPTRRHRQFILNKKSDDGNSCAHHFSPTSNIGNIDRGSARSKPSDSLDRNERFRRLNQMIDASIGGVSTAIGDPDGLTRSRLQLLQFRDAIQNQNYLSKPDVRYSRLDSYSPDSLEISPRSRQSKAKSSTKIRSWSPNKKASSDTFIPKIKKNFPAFSSVPNTPSKPSDTTYFTNNNMSGLTCRGNRTPIRRKSELPWSAIPLNKKQHHRSPTKRSPARSPSRRSHKVEEWMKRASSPRRESFAFIPYHRSLRNENTNRFRDCSSSIDLSGSYRYEDEYPFRGRFLSTIGGDDTVDRLLDEKRRLDLKYGNNPTSWKSFSAPPSPYLSRWPEDYHGLYTPDLSDRLRFERDSPNLPEREFDLLSSNNRLTSDCLQDSVNQLRRETDICRRRRQQPISREASLKETLKDVYDNRGTFTREATQSNSLSMKNKNWNSLQNGFNSTAGKLFGYYEEKTEKRDSHPKEAQGHYSPLEERKESSVKGFYEAPFALLGEVAFQLERRIIRQVFQGLSTASDGDLKANDDKKSGDDLDKRHRFYGFTVLNLPQKIRSDSRDPVTGKRNGARESCLLHRFQEVIIYLKNTFGYRISKHAKMCQDLINRYGLFHQPPDFLDISRLGLDDFRSVRNHVIRLSDIEERADLLILVDCLYALGQRENKPILWFH